MMTDEYATTVRKFWQEYTPIARRHNLRIRTQCHIKKPCRIEIWQGEGAGAVRILKIEEEDETHCYKRATEDLISWDKNIQSKYEIYTAS